MGNAKCICVYKSSKTCTFEEKFFQKRNEYYICWKIEQHVYKIIIIKKKNV